MQLIRKGKQSSLVDACYHFLVVEMRSALLTVLLTQLVSCAYCGGNDGPPQVVIISLDGFPKEQLARHTWDHLNWVYAHGSHPRRFINQFPTKSFPNHFSMATGLFQESHGVVGNTVFDPNLNCTLTVKDPELFTQNPDVMPLWTLNELHGSHSGCIMWPGCDVPFHGRNTTFFEPYRHNATFNDEVDLAVKWLTHPMKPVNLLFIYHDQPDVVGHMYGTNSTYYDRELKKIDAGLGYLFHLLDLRELKQKVDVVILSDHGMTPISSRTGIINLDSVLDPGLYTFTGSSPVLNIWPIKEKDLLYVYAELQKGSKTHNYKVYLKEDAQMKAWHYKSNPRISSITLVANGGYVFQDFKDIIKSYKEEGHPGLTEMFGDHGYEVGNPSMEPIFVAVGPSFRQKFTAGDFTNLDIYPLVCLILDLPPGPNNGSLDNIYPILAQPISTRLVQPILGALACLVVLGVVVMAVACKIHGREKRLPVSADALINGYVYRKTMTKNKQSTDESEEECLLDDEEIDLV